MNWTKKDIWKPTYADRILLEVCRHDKWEGKHGWCLYAYFYPKHELFTYIKSEYDRVGADYYGGYEKIHDLPWHGGITYFEAHQSAGEITSFQFGCDYSHVMDELHEANADNPSYLQSDAEYLLDAIKELEETEDVSR